MRLIGLIFFSILLSLPDSASAGSLTSFGSFLSSYKMPLKNGGGCISGSIGDAVPGNNSASIYFVSEENAANLRKSGYISYVDDVKKNEFLPGISTFTMCLKPGRYRIYGITTSIVYSANRFNVPFDVVEGKHFYIGSFIFYGYTPNPDCELTTAEVFVGVRNEFSRDSAYIEKNFDTSGTPLEDRAINPQAGAPYFVKCSS